MKVVVLLLDKVELNSSVRLSTCKNYPDPTIGKPIQSHF